MPFGLRNAGATYQRCMNHVFDEHIGRTVEAYVDDIVVKTRKASDLLSDLEVTFRCPKAKGVKLNPEKCVFGVPRDMLLGFTVSKRGIEANPEKTATITSMGPIKDLKGVQRVMGCLAALSLFIPHLGKGGLPLYRLGANNVPPGSQLPRPASTPRQKSTTRPSPRHPRPSPRYLRLSPRHHRHGQRHPQLGLRHPRHPRARHCASRRSEAGSCLIEAGRPRTCNISTEESYPSTEPKLGGWRGAPSRSSCWGMGRSSTTTPRALVGDTRGLHAPLGRAACHHQSSEAWNKRTGRQSRRSLHQHFERLTATSPLPLRCFQVVRLLCPCASFSHQGRVSPASAEPDPPSGAKRGEPLCVKIFNRKGFCVPPAMSEAGPQGANVGACKWRG
jgi:hypothetical protein